jgi:hypothetical protein
VFAALAIVLFASTLVRIDTAWVGDDRDPHLFIWYLGWTPHQLGALRSPFFTTALQAPGGANLMWNTAVFAPAVVLWPVTAAFGPVVSYNVMATAAVALSGWCAFLAARRLVANDLAAAVAGLVYGFSPYMTAQSLRHPHVTVALFPPLALLLLHEILGVRPERQADLWRPGTPSPGLASAVLAHALEGDRSAPRRRPRIWGTWTPNLSPASPAGPLVRRRRPLLAGGLLGVASAVQLLTGEEILALTVLVAILGTGLLALLRRDEAVARARRALPAFASAAACFAVLAGYPLAQQFLGPLRVSGLLQPPDVYVTDLLAFVAPASPMALGGGAAAALTDRFTGNVSENDAYIGVPLLVLLLAATVLGRRRPLVRWAVPLTLTAALLSMGPHLHVAGRVLPVPLPWAALGRLPLLESVVPARLMLFAFLGIGLLLADLLGAWGGKTSSYSVSRWSRWWSGAEHRSAAYSSIGERGAEDPGRQMGRMGAEEPTAYRPALLRPGPRHLLLLAVVAVTLVPLVPRWPYSSTVDATPAFFRPGGEVARVPPGGMVLVTPYANHLSSVAMLWQAHAGYRFRMPEGEAFVPGPSLGPPPSDLQRTLAALDSGQAVPASAVDVARTRGELAALGVGTVVAGPSAGHDRVVGYLTSVLGRPPVRSGGVDVWWQVPAG